MKAYVVVNINVEFEPKIYCFVFMCITQDSMRTCAVRFRFTETMLRFTELYFYTDLNIRECPIENYLCFLLSLFHDTVSTDTLYVSNDKLHNEHEEGTW
jgi:hypothetical protein